MISGESIRPWPKDMKYDHSPTRTTGLNQPHLNFHKQILVLGSSAYFGLPFSSCGQQETTSTPSQWAHRYRTARLRFDTTLPASEYTATYQSLSLIQRLLSLPSNKMTQFQANSTSSDCTIREESSVRTSRMKSDQLLISVLCQTFIHVKWETEMWFSWRWATHTCQSGYALTEEKCRTRTHFKAESCNASTKLEPHKLTFKLDV